MSERYDAEPVLAQAQTETATETIMETTMEIAREASDTASVNADEVSLNEQDTPKSIIAEDLSAAQESIIAEETPCATQTQCALQCVEPERADEDAQTAPRVKEDKGLMFFKKWWFRREVDFCVNGEKITGTPIVLNDDTLRVVDEQYSYFIPVKNVDYIRTKDGYGQF